MLNELPLLFDGAAIPASFKSSADDFIVEEALSFTPDGDGDHVFLQITKRHTNTNWLAGQLARWAGVKRRDVGYAGLKDRHAVATQWFSVLLPGKDMPDWQQFNVDDVAIVQVTRSRRKLRPGAITANHFRIRLRDINADQEVIDQRLQMIRQRGVPNYFAAQRFGHDGDNLVQARRLLRGECQVRDRQQKSLYLSAARSHLFNRVLAERVREGNWDRAIVGDCMVLDGSHSYFHIDEPDEEIRRRVTEFDIHPSGPLWGAGEPPVSGQAALLEQAVLRQDAELMTGLVEQGLKMDRRPLRLYVRNLSWQYQNDRSLDLILTLGAGEYATTVLSQVFDLREPDRHHDARMND